MQHLLRVSILTHELVAALVAALSELILTRYTQPAPELKLLLEKLRIALPPQPPPKITAAQAASATPV
jgi:hypothetical protein